jgi:phospholipid transport system substrate-binding protein
MRYSFLLLLLGLIAQPVTAEDAGPDQLVAEVAGNLLELLTENRERYLEHPEELTTVVTDELLPIFDLQRSARLILGRHGRNATPEQVEGFANAMSSLLSQRYAEGLLQFNSEDQIQVLPLKGNNSDRLTKVQTRIKLDSGGFAPVDYVFRKTENGWKAFDVSVEGISYIITYRNQFGPEIQKDGLDTVIARLERGEVQLPE